MIATESSGYRDPHSLIVMDAKELYDALQSDQPQGQDERATLEIAIIKESMIVVRARPRWIPHNLNPTDGLTKMVGAHMEPMLKLLQSNEFCIEQEEAVLERGKQGAHRLKLGTKNHGNDQFLGLTNRNKQSRRL